jgi:sugar phosphate isomerase/epimerase
MVKTCVATWTVKSESLARALRVLAGMGFHAMSFCSGQQGAIIKEWPDLLAILRERDLDVLLHLAIGGNPRTPKDVELAPQLAFALRLHEKTGRVATVCFDPAWQLDESKKVVADLPGTIAGLRHAIETLTPCGICVGIENWSISGRLDQLEQIKKGVGYSALGMLLDVGHAHIMVAQKILPPGMTTESFIDALPFPIYELHLHDNHGNLDEHLPLGSGDARLAPVIRALKRKGFSGYATAEIIPNMKAIPIDDATGMEGVRRTKEIFECEWGRKT